MNHLVIDTETTGLSPRFNKTLTVGLLLINPFKPKLQIIDQAHIFVKHEKYNTTKEAMKVNKIDLDAHNKYAVPPKKACQQINAFLEKNSLQKTPIVGHNIHFDINFLQALFNQGKKEYPFHEETIDTIKIWKNLQKEELIPKHLRATLGHLANHFEIDYEKAHDALADCHITAQVYHKMLRLKQNQKPSQNLINQINQPTIQL